ncbi:MAG: hypothetical protein HYV35_07515 [Lentisphaerae bacterium]|nr:hypothetical protein [Lentisphaerota bacterium]
MAAISGALAARANDTSGSDREFPAQCAALALAAERLPELGQGQGTMTVTGRDGWLFLAAELRHLGLGEFWGEAAAKVSRAAKPEWADPLPAILDFHEQLASRGIELLMVPVPPKAVIYPEFLPGEAAQNPAGTSSRHDVILQAFYRELQQKNIQVLDLTAVFLNNRAKGDAALYCRQDSHWSGAGCVLAAAEIGRKLAGAFKDRSKLSLTSAWETVEISGDLWSALGEPKPPRERLRVRRVSQAGTREAVAPDQKSPVILLGDSHSLVFHGGEDMLARGAGLFDQLVLELGFPLDLVAVRGSGATPARINLLRRAQKDPDYWVGKKWVIWCFAAREFTESDGWRKVPLKP